MRERDADDADARAMALVADGHRAAFDAVARRHAGAMKRLARAVAGDDATAADATQEALVAAYRGAASYRPELGSVRNWMLTIARNSALRAVRPRREEPRAEIGPELLELGVAAGWGSADPERSVEAAQDAERLAFAIASLALPDREILLLRDVEGLSGEDTARALELTLAAMKSRLHRARLRLLAALQEGVSGLASQDRIVGALRCSEVLARLGDYVDGELAPADLRQVEDHLRDCTVCERFGGRFSRVVRSVRTSLGAAPAADEAVLARVREALGR